MEAIPRSGPAATARDDLKVAAVWGLLAGMSAAAVMPYLVQLMPERFAALPVPLGVLAAAQGVQAALLIGLLAWLGLRMGHRVGLGSPLLQAWINARPHPGWRRLRPLHAALLGVAAAALILLLASLLDPMLPDTARAAVQPSAWSGLLAAFYGGIAEELQLRLFLMTLVAWLLTGLGRRAPASWQAWTAIAIAALLFGIGHLPAAAAIWGLDPIVVLRTLLLNGIGGLAFGWLYWRRGLEMAMLAHFCADLALHVAIPLIAPGATA